MEFWVLKGNYNINSSKGVQIEKLKIIFKWLFSEKKD
jgi:hypothetical protein